MVNTDEHDIVPVHLAVKALRDSGYKNAAHAIAELIDNSLQAGATNVQLLCAEMYQNTGTRNRAQINEIAVVDNGSGMDASTLRQALAFGNGTRLNDRSGMGRFGMGLPNSSLSQAARVDVWTWQGGAEPIHTYLDLHEINAGKLKSVPAPAKRAIPIVWRSAAQRLGKSGTLVVWSKIDRCQWRTARAIIDNSEFAIGRMYRMFLQSGKASIRMAAFDINDPSNFSIEKLAKANDPMYLMPNTSCPAPWDQTAMFEPYGEPYEIPVARDGKTHIVRVTLSIAKKPAREGYNPGSRDHGQHAAHNVGVSIVRAKRELELQLAWTTRHDPRERWWGAQVEFPPALDEVFGVTNDKQSARALADLANLDADEIAEREGFDSLQELKSEWTQLDEPRLILLNVKQYLDSNLNQIRALLRTQTAQGTKLTRHPDSAEAKATEATRQRQIDGHRGESDAAESDPIDKRRVEIEQGFIEAGFEPDIANERAVRILEDRRKYEFMHASIETDAFFTVRPKGGTLLISINTDHPAYQHLVALLEQDPDESDLAAIRQRMRQSYEGLKLLIEAWARYEDELPLEQKDRAKEVRADWGRVAKQFLMQD